MGEFLSPERQQGGQIEGDRHPHNNDYVPHPDHCDVRPVVNSVLDTNVPETTEAICQGVDSFVGVL